MADLERIKKDVVEMDSRANVCWYDTKVLTKAVRLILEELTADRKTENSSEIPNNCKYAENPSGDVWECGCFPDTYCEHQIYDMNPDGTINIVECGYEPTDEPQERSE